MRLTSPLGPIARGIACAALIGVCVHIATVLAVPSLSRADAYSRIAVLDSELKPRPLVAGMAGLDPLEDPGIVAVACAFDLAAGPVKLSLPVTPDGFASIALHQEGGGAFFALSNSAASNGRLEVVALTPSQAVERAADDDEDNPSAEVRAVANKPRGFAVFRALALLPSDRPAAAAIVAGASCTRAE